MRMETAGCIGRIGTGKKVSEPAESRAQSIRWLLRRDRCIRGARARGLEREREPGQLSYACRGGGRNRTHIYLSGAPFAARALLPLCALMRGALDANVSFFREIERGREMDERNELT